MFYLQPALLLFNYKILGDEQKKTMAALLLSFYLNSIIPPTTFFTSLCFGFPWISILPPALTVAFTALEA